MTKAKHKTNLKAVVLLLLVGILALAGIVPAFAVQPDGENASTTTATGYYMRISLKGLETNLEGKDAARDDMKLAGGFKAWSRTQKIASFVFTFVDVKHEERQVYVSGLALAEFPARIGTGDNVDFKDDVIMNIRESFYNKFMDCGFSAKSNQSFRIMVLLANNGYNLYNKGTIVTTKNVFTRSVELYTKELSGDPNDPDDPNFELGDNGGQNPNWQPESAENFLQWLYNSLTKVFKWNLTYTQFLWIFWSIVGVLGLVLIMPLLRRIFGW